RHECVLRRRSQARCGAKRTVKISLDMREIRRALRWLGRLFFTLGIVLFCGFWLFFYVAIGDTDLGCFGTLFPTYPQIAQRTNVKFPLSMTNLTWDCINTLDQDGVRLRFTIDASDEDEFIASTAGYNDWSPYRPSDGLEDYFFYLFIDHPANEQDLISYKTWQSSTTCGWGNYMLDMDNPDIYTVYIDYSDYEHGLCPPQK
ncbi:MAG: hypothetical protein ABI835_08920, partial [Chloroflexota bacterium]